MWYITAYKPVGLISLKLSTATSTGGKSLLLPTPFAFKMALLDVIIRDIGLARGKALWPQVRNGQIAINGPRRITVNNTFIKILKPKKGKSTQDPDTGLTRPMVNTIAFREYVQWQGDLEIAFQPGDESDDPWQRWLTMITYLGKRGGFVQAATSHFLSMHLPDSFTSLLPVGTQFPLNGTLQILDDCGPNLTFEQVDIYSSKAMKLGRDRILHHVILPYRLTRSSRGYSLYERIDG